MKFSFVLAAFMFSSIAAAEQYGSYQVPVPTELESYAQFELENTEVATANGRTKVTYHLPAALVGTQHPVITLEGKPKGRGVLILKGEYGKASCFERNSELECIVDYKHLEINSRDVSDHLRSITTDPTELAGRERVAEIFKTEPIGILTIQR